MWMIRIGLAVAWASLAALLPVVVSAKGGKAHVADMIESKGGVEVRARGGLSIETINTGAIDATPGVAGRRSMAEATEVSPEVAELSFAGLLKQNNLRIPTSAQIREAYGVTGRGSHRASTHVLYWDGASRERYARACVLANPGLPSEFVAKQVDDAARRLMMLSEAMYRDVLRGTEKAAALAPKLARLDVLVHYLGDYTTSRTMGLPGLELLSEEIVRQTEGVWTPAAREAFRETVAGLIGREADVGTVAETMLRLVAENGDCVAEGIRDVMAGRAFRKLSVIKTKALVRHVVRLLDWEIRMRAIPYLGEALAGNASARTALLRIGPRPSYKGIRPFTLLESCGLVEKYMTEGLEETDHATLRAYMTARGVPENIRERTLTHPELRPGVSGRACVAARLLPPAREKGRVTDAGRGHGRGDVGAVAKRL